MVMAPVRLRPVTQTGYQVRAFRRQALDFQVERDLPRQLLFFHRGTSNQGNLAVEVGDGPVQRALGTERPKAGRSRPPPWGSSKVAKPHLLEAAEQGVSINRLVSAKLAM